MGLRETILQKIKKEIADDPQSLGYAGKTCAEVVDMLNGDVTKWKQVKVKSPAPINRILEGLKDGPNYITEQEVIDAQQVVI